MATQIIRTTFQLKRGYSESWERNNPILDPGEPGWTLDTHELRIGDGCTPWRDLVSIGKGDYITAEEVKELLEGVITTEELEQLLEEVAPKEKYEVEATPSGTLLTKRESEIRIMCPKDTQWSKQSSGENADPNSYYIGLKIYAPSKDIYGFKEDLAEIISDQTLYTFENNPFAGIDADGRKYSIVWLPVARYDEATNTWTYHGAKSTTKKFIGWYYSVEWYNEEKQLVDSQTIRINLSNEECHNFAEPYYMGSINVNKLVQNEQESLVLYGGSASENL